MAKLRFLIASPRYNHQTAGVMVLHDLCDMLNRQGYEAAIALFGGSGPHFHWAFSNSPEYYHPQHQRTHIPFDNADHAIRDFLRDGVVIYPDLVPDNPLAGSRVVRFLLYMNHSYQPQGSHELVLSFSRMFHDHPHAELFKTFVGPELHAKGSRHWSQRTLDITYTGKGANFATCHRIPGSLALSRTWPEDKEQLGALLRQCRYFFTWDSVSQTNIDAVACGAIPVMLQDKQARRAEVNNTELGEYPNICLSDLLNPKSVKCDPAEVDAQVAAMLSKVTHYSETWPARVRTFAEAAHTFYNFV